MGLDFPNEGIDSKRQQALKAVSVEIGIDAVVM